MHTTPVDQTQRILSAMDGPVHDLRGAVSALLALADGDGPKQPLERKAVQYIADQMGRHIADLQQTLTPSGTAQ